MRSYRREFTILFIALALFAGCSQKVKSPEADELEGAVRDLGSAITKLAINEVANRSQDKATGLTEDQARQLVGKVAEVAKAYYDLADKYARRKSMGEQAVELITDSLDLAARYSALIAQLGPSLSSLDASAIRILTDSQGLVDAAARLLAK